GPLCNGKVYKHFCFCFSRKRSISEVQFMHNVQEHKQVGERQDWLQEKLKKIIIPSPKPQYVRPGNPKSLPPENETKEILATLKENSRSAHCKLILMVS
uniref:Parathyroid hormone n=1 Tax=Xiphophorus maculatus TaxID=8083 RepID=A0A3B5QTZ4_XIPMA